MLIASCTARNRPNCQAPIRSPSLSSTTSPTWMPTRNSIRRRSDRCGAGVAAQMSASLIGHSRSSAFRLSAGCGVDVTHGLVLLFGIGTRPLYGAFVVKEFARQQIFCPSSVLCSISKTVSFARPALRPGRRAVKVGRCTSLAACFAFSLTASRATARLRGRDNDQRGARYGRPTRPVTWTFTIGAKPSRLLQQLGQNLLGALAPGFALNQRPI